MEHGRFWICKFTVQGGREVTVPRPIRYHNLIWITYVHLVTCPVDPYVHLDAGHTNIRLLLTHTVCPCAVSYAPTQSVPIESEVRIVWVYADFSAGWQQCPR